MGLNEGDIRRIVWTFVMAVAAYGVATYADWVPGNAVSLKTLIVGGLAAGLSAVKNLVLPDGSSLK